MMPRPRTLAFRLALLLVLIVASLLVPSVAVAHAELETVVPEADATVQGTPTEISATFSEGLEPDSALSLRDDSGGEIASGGLDPADPARLLIDPVPELTPGTYQVRWTSVTDDGHIERDTWSFIVTAPPPSPTPTPSAAPSATPAPTASPTLAPSPTVAPSPSADGGDATGDSSDVILPIIVALALVAIVGGFLLTRRGRSTPST